MGVKQMLARAGDKAGNKVADLAKLSGSQVKEIENNREQYLKEKPDPQDHNSIELTEKLLAATGIEIYNAYLPQIQQLYLPVDEKAEYEDKEFNVDHNIRYFKITKWVTDKKENSLEKLVNVYEVLSNEECNIALIFHRGIKGTDVYLAVTNTNNADNNIDASSYINRIEDAIRGNFSGSEWSKVEQGIVPCLKNLNDDAVAIATNIPTEKSEKFISQTIEKLLDGIVPDSKKKEYTIILLATPIQDVDSQKLRLEEIYSGLAPYAGWQTNYTYLENNTVGSSATVGINVGASAGIQNGQNSSTTDSNAITKSENNTDATNQAKTVNETKGETKGETQSTNQTKAVQNATQHTSGQNFSKNESESVGVDFGPQIAKLQENFSKGISEGWSASDSFTKAVTESFGETYGKSVAESFQHGIANTVGKTISKTLGKAVTKTAAVTEGVFKSTNLGVNFGANFARSSTVSTTIGKNEGITQNFTNYNIKHALELLEEQLKRYEESSALGMWNFATYVVSEDYDVANNVAHSYIALTEGTKSFMSKAAINLWRGDTDDKSAEEICSYLRTLRHPIFGLNLDLLKQDESLNVYPSIVTATTPLTGKELAYSLNFPKKSVVGLPVIECAEFGRNVITYEGAFKDPDQLHLGHIFHMNHEELTDVALSKQSLASHVFITGSTGSGKSNTVYQIINEAWKKDVKFLVIEPAKGEYKDVFGNDADVSVYGTNPDLTQLLKINPFSFPKQIHVYEHMDRLVEIFNVCWPMYAAMPAVLKSAIEQSYEDCGWDLIRSENKYGSNMYPTFDDVARNIRTIIDSSEYDAENKGAYKGSLLTRLQSLTNGINGMIFSEEAIPDTKLFDQNVIIDLSRVGSSETKSLLMGILVMKLQEYRMSQESGMNRNLQHITVLEEAHNLLKRTSTEQPVEGGNLLGKSVEMLANAIAEMRTYGEGFIIVDQAPGLLDMSAIRNTNTKIILRLPAQEDRELSGRAAGLNDDQINELAKLPCGVAAVYQNDWIQPVLCKVDYYKHDNEKYHFVRIYSNKKGISIDDSLKIAELLSNGTQLDDVHILKDVKPLLNDSGLPASLKVTIYKMLSNPPKEPRMTKLAPIISKLFPMESDAMKNIYSETSDPAEWTRTVEHQLYDTLNERIDDQVRRDIVQCIVTNYLINEKNNIDAYQKWSAEGDLH